MSQAISPEEKISTSVTQIISTATPLPLFEEKEIKEEKTDSTELNQKEEKKR